MLHVVRTDSKNKDFIAFIKYLDAYLAEKDGDEHSFYDQFNKIEHIKYVIVLYDEGKPLGCGALKQYDPKSAEIKRMYTTPESRGKGVATKILSELEKWATELSYENCILETGKRQAEAVNLYKKNGYILGENYGQYIGMDNSLCFKKTLHF